MYSQRAGIIKMAVSPKSRVVAKNRHRAQNAHASRSAVNACRSLAVVTYYHLDTVNSPSVALPLVVDCVPGRVQIPSSPPGTPHANEKADNPCDQMAR